MGPSFPAAPPLSHLACSRRCTWGNKAPTHKPQVMKAASNPAAARPEAMTPLPTSGSTMTGAVIQRTHLVPRPPDFATEGRLLCDALSKLSAPPGAYG